VVRTFRLTTPEGWPFAVRTQSSRRYLVVDHRLRAIVRRTNDRRVAERETQRLGDRGMLVDTWYVE
jgi:hypothetical protein